MSCSHANVYKCSSFFFFLCGCEELQANCSVRDHDQTPLVHLRLMWWVSRLSKTHQSRGGDLPDWCSTGDSLSVFLCTCCWATERTGTQSGEVCKVKCKKGLLWSINTIWHCLISDKWQLECLNKMIWITRARELPSLPVSSSCYLPIVLIPAFSC